MIGHQAVAEETAREFADRGQIGLAGLISIKQACAIGFAMDQMVCVGANPMTPYGGLNKTRLAQKSMGIDDKVQQAFRLRMG